MAHMNNSIALLSLVVISFTGLGLGSALYQGSKAVYPDVQPTTMATACNAMDEVMQQYHGCN
jgi:hypothetical protein